VSLTEALEAFSKKADLEHDKKLMLVFDDKLNESQQFQSGSALQDLEDALYSVDV